MLSYLEYLNLPSKVGIAIVLFLVICNIIGEFLELKGKVVPEFVKFRKYFARKKQERITLSKITDLLEEHQQMAQTISSVNTLLNEINQHYSKDNITKRDNWMNWVNNRAIVYDDSIVEIGEKLKDVTQALRDNTKMTEEMFVQSSRDRIIDFATKVGNENTMVSREEFNRIFKVYDKYEKFLDEHELTNGEIDINYQIIKESYEKHMKNHTFTEDIHGYNS